MTPCLGDSVLHCVEHAANKNKFSYDKIQINITHDAWINVLVMTEIKNGRQAATLSSFFMIEPCMHVLPLLKIFFY